MKKKLGIPFFLMTMILALSSAYALSAHAETEQDESSQIESYSTDKFDLRGKTFNGTYSGRSCSLKFFSQQYNSVQDTCLELSDDGRVTYIYFNYDSLWDSDTNTLSAYTSAVTGYWANYAPLTVKCQWLNDKLTAKISLTNGMSILMGDFDLSTSEHDPDIPDSSENEAILTLDPTYGVVIGEVSYVTGTYVAENPSSIQSELGSLKWEIEDEGLISIGEFTYVLDQDNKRATWMLEIQGLHHGETELSVKNNNKAWATTLVVEPALILPDDNASFVDEYDSTVVIISESYISINVKLDESDKNYLEDFLASIKVNIVKEPSSSSNAIIDISNQKYDVSDDSMTGEYIIPISPVDYGCGNVDNIVTISTKAQNKTIRIIRDEDADKDGIPDIWELNGIDYDGDNDIDLDLKAMGAVVGNKDIFIEVDAMQGLAPSQSALNIVAEQFKKHGFYLHIDAGADSIDYVTGRIWGDMSGSNTLPFEKFTSLGTPDGKGWYKDYDRWIALHENNMDRRRSPVFKHCIFVNQFNEDRNTGIASDIPGQYFLCALMSGKNDIAVAGTFMHELGHTLGLRHGGDDDIRFKPNYLSIMNYLYQTTGLSGTREVNYSEYELPAMDTTKLNENNGIDPDGLTNNSGLGTKWKLSKEKNYEAKNISGRAIDFNKNGNIESLVNVKFYTGGTDVTTFSRSINDWNHLILSGGSIGNMGSAMDDYRLEILFDNVVREEISIEELMDLENTEEVVIDDGSKDNPPSIVPSSPSGTNGSDGSNSANGNLSVRQTSEISTSVNTGDENKLVIYLLILCASTLWLTIIGVRKIVK